MESVILSVIVLWLGFLSTRMGVLMATEAEFEAAVGAIEVGVAELAVEIANLKASQGPVTQEQLDALTARASAIVTAIEAAK